MEKESKNIECLSVNLVVGLPVGLPAGLPVGLVEGIPVGLPVGSVGFTINGCEINNKLQQ